MQNSGKKKIKALFLCVGNSCRSQMAEGWARHLHGGLIEASSAGTVPKGVDPYAVEVMKEAGVDISAHLSKKLDELKGISFDLVVTLCSEAQACPVPPLAGKIIHAPFDDPPLLAKGAATRQEALTHYRRVRDEIRQFILRLPEILKK